MFKKNQGGKKPKLPTEILREQQARERQKAEQARAALPPEERKRHEEVDDLLKSDFLKNLPYQSSDEVKEECSSLASKIDGFKFIRGGGNQWGSFIIKKSSGLDNVFIETMAKISLFNQKNPGLIDESTLKLDQNINNQNLIKIEFDHTKKGANIALAILKNECEKLDLINENENVNRP